MKTLQNIKELNDLLFNYLNEEYFKKSKANYLYITKIDCIYDAEGYDVWNYDIYIEWGRGYEDPEKEEKWGERHTCVIPVQPNYLENYDFILGKFVSILDGKDYDTTKKD